MPPAVDAAIARMMDRQEPYPLTVLSADYDLLRANKSATTLFGVFVAEPDQLPTPLNMFSLMFDPRFLRPFVVNWAQMARQMLARLRRETLNDRGGGRREALIERVLAYPDVPRAWLQPDFSSDCEPTFSVRLARDELRLAFLTTVTVFSAPQQVTLDELRIESAFPLDGETRIACERLANG